MSKQLKDYAPGYPARVASEWSNNVLGTNFGKDTKPFRVNITYNSETYAADPANICVYNNLT